MAIDPAFKSWHQKQNQLLPLLSTRTRHHGSEERLVVVVVVKGENHAAHLRMRRSELAADIDPLPSGSRASRSAMCGAAAGMRCSASAQVAASPTTTRSGVEPRRSVRPRRTSS